jgi:aspartate carbamoyltransferase catalytic subunit
MAEQLSPPPAPQLRADGSLRHLLTLEGLAPAMVQRLLDRAAYFSRPLAEPAARSASLNGKTVAVMFAEPSTRTRVSFELAARRLGADVINIEVQLSSRLKGESVLDTVATLESMHVDAFVLRDADAAVPHLVAHHVAPQVSVLSGGAGSEAHPTQGLLDALTVLQHKGRIQGLRIAIVGDIRHSRVARSSWQASGIEGCDVIMMLRIQKERMAAAAIPDEASYFAEWGLTPDRLRVAQKDAIVMHPQPMNRGVEIASEVADGPQSVIRDQVRNGVAVRMAVLEQTLLGGSR